MGIHGYWTFVFPINKNVIENIMKNILNRIVLLSLVTFAFYSCNTDEIKTVMSPVGEAPTLTATKTTFVLTPAVAADTTAIFTWNPSNYGFQAAVKYTLQIAKAGTNFALAKEVSLGNNLQYKYTAAEFNQLALLQGLKPSAVGQLEVRVKSNLSESVADIYSNKVTLSVTPYIVIINYPSLWVPGEYQGWSPDKAPKISSRNANGIYEGYVNINGAFKYTSNPDWNNTIYGWASSTTVGNNVSGTFNKTGGNLFVPVSGFYLLKANTVNSTWSATKTTWAIIGNAPAGSNWANDVPLVYDAVKNVWKVTAVFAAGEFKFRANGDWALNFGDTGADTSLEYDGANIVIPTSLAGSRTITLDLKAGNYTYTIE